MHMEHGSIPESRAGTGKVIKRGVAHPDYSGGARQRRGGLAADGKSVARSIEALAARSVDGRGLNLVVARAESPVRGSLPPLARAGGTVGASLPPVAKNM